MLVQVSTDHNIEGHEALSAQVIAVVEAALSHHGDVITRVEVHFSDENSSVKPDDCAIRCVMVVRMERHDAMVVTHDDSSVNRAIDGATDKMVRLVNHTMERIHASSVRAG